MYSLNSGSSPDTASRLLQPHPRVPASPRPPRAARACWPHSNRCRPNTAGGSPQLGAVDPQDHRGRPAGLPPLWRDPEGHCRDRRRGGHLPDPVPPEPAGSRGRSPVPAPGRSVRLPSSGQQRLPAGVGIRTALRRLPLAGLRVDAAPAPSPTGQDGWYPPKRPPRIDPDLPPFGQFPLTSHRAASSVPPREQDLGSVALGEALTGSPRPRSGPVSSPSR